MKICDLTQSYTETSGGVRTFIHTKRNYITEQTKHQHLLIVPGEQDSIERDGRATTVKIAANRVRGCEPYRFITRLDKVFAVLQKERPDIIELGSGYIFPMWPFYIVQSITNLSQLFITPTFRAPTFILH